MHPPIGDPWNSSFPFNPVHDELHPLLMSVDQHALVCGVAGRCTVTGVSAVGIAMAARKHA